jgi:pimeloyl-ACP methyl ester carboxylesterase
VERGVGRLQHVDVGGLSLAYRRAGSGPPLVLLHGAYQDSRYWGPQLADLSGEFTVIAPDTPGSVDLTTRRTRGPRPTTRTVWRRSSARSA